jgi:hypothetical protein
MNGIVRVAVIVVAAAAVVATGIVVARGAKEASTRLGPDVGAMIDLLGPAPDSVEGSALWGRYKAQREVVVAMRAHLEQLVALDSAFVRDSAYPWSFVQSLRLRPAPPSRVYFTPYEPRMTPSGWYAVADGGLIACAVAVGPDTSIRGAPPGTPVCYSQQ